MKVNSIWFWWLLECCLFMSVLVNIGQSTVQFNPIKCLKSRDGKTSCIVSNWDDYVSFYSSKIQAVIPNDTRELTIYCITEKISNISLSLEFNDTQIHKLLFWNCDFNKFPDEGLNGNCFKTLQSLVFHIKPKFLGLGVGRVQPKTFSVERLCALKNLTSLAFIGFKVKTISQTLPFSNTTCCNRLIFLNFSHNSIANIAKGTFNNLNNLQVLDLSKNFVDYLDKIEVAKLKSLRRLILTGNFFTELDLGVFQLNNALSEIEIGNYVSKYYNAAPDDLVVQKSIKQFETKGKCVKKIDLEQNDYKILERLTSFSICMSNSRQFEDLFVDSLTNIKKLSLIFPVSKSQKPVQKEEMRQFLKNVLNKMINLTELSLNYVGPLYPRMFENMSQLQVLNLTITGDTSIAANGSIFIGLPNLQSLNVDFKKYGKLASKELVNAEKFFRELTNLKTFIAINLPLSFVSCSTFASLSYLTISSVTERQLQNIHSCICVNGVAINLTELQLRNNSIQSLQKFDFQDCHNLQLVDFSYNDLIYINDDYYRESVQDTEIPTGPFSKMKKLVKLILSYNNITHFDFYMIPKSLLHLDLTRNFITSVNDVTSICTTLNLQTLILYQNRLVKFSSNVMPPSITQLFLGDWIWMSEYESLVSLPFRFNKDDFANLKNAEIIELDFNKNFNAERPSFSNHPSIVNTYFSITWYKICGALSKYLLDVYPTGYVNCNTLSRRIDDFRIIPFYDDVLEQNINCQFMKKCGYKCVELSCTISDECTSIDPWASNVLDCGTVGLQDFPVKYPEGLTIHWLFLDGNNLRSVPADVLYSFPDTTVALFLNSSHISEIHNDVFKYQTYIQVLHLENNEITNFTRFLDPIRNSLQFLYLQNNRIITVDIPKCYRLSLISLHLENNLLTYLHTPWLMIAVAEDDYTNRVTGDRQTIGKKGYTQEIIVRNNSIREITKLKSAKDPYEIDLSHNIVCKIQPRSFEDLNYLQVLNLEYNNILALNGTEFHGLLRLEKLMLNNNCIRKIKPKTFSDLNKLEDLHLNNNLLTILYSQEFTGLNNLQRLYLYENKLKILQNYTFSGLSSLLYLDLSKNEIATLEKNVFSDLKNLMYLNLSQNEIKDLSLDFPLNFQHFELRLSNNLLTTLETTTFVNLHNLEVLYLDNNKLIKPQIWKLPESIKLLYLASNSLSCDCDFMLVFQKWISGTGYNKLQNTDRTICTDSNTKKTHKILEFDVAVCQISYELVLGISTGVLFVLFCVLGALYYWRLELQVWVYSRYGLRIFYKDRDTEDKPYDVFIAYSSDDEEFIINELVPGLKDYRICIHFKDFPAGAFITEAIMEAVEQSSRTLLIFSPRFLQSPWCKFEFKTAHYKSLQDRCCRLILIILEDVEENEMEPEQKAYLRTNTYLRWDDRMFWEKLKFALPNIRPDAPPLPALLHLACE